MPIQDLGRAAATAKQLATIAKIVAGLKKVRAANTSGLGPSGNTGGGGGGGGAVAPASILAGLPKSALLDTLVKNGLIKEGMPPEQALAVLKFAQLREGVPINVAELMKLVSADYAKTTGDIETAGADWMKEMMGTAYDPNDPNAAMFANDPTFSSYAGGLAQMGETADTNEATDLAWFRKEQEAQETYYNDMMNAISTGTLPIGAAAAGGGGGGGGGGGRGGGGYGGGGGSGSGEAGDLRTRITTDEGVTETANERVLNTLPGFRPDMLGFASQFGPEVLDQIEEIVNLTPSGRGQDVLAALEEKQQLMDAENTAFDAVQENNAMWSATAPAEFRRLLDDYEARTGLSIGDDPNVPGEQAFHYAERTGDDPRTDVQEGPENVYTYSPADTQLLPEEQRAEIEELRTLLEPALLGATGNNVNDPANISKAANAVGYLQSLAQNRLASDTANTFQAGIEDLGTASTDELVTDPSTGIASPVSAPTSNPFAQIIAQVAGQIGQSAGARGAVVPGQPPSPSFGPYTDPNIVQPPGSEVPNTPENNLAYFEATGNMPQTPVTDNPFPNRPPASNVLPATGGWGSWEQANQRPPLDANMMAQIIGGASGAPRYNVLSSATSGTPVIPPVTINGQPNPAYEEYIQQIRGRPSPRDDVPYSPTSGTRQDITGQPIPPANSLDILASGGFPGAGANFMRSPVMQALAQARLQMPQEDTPEDPSEDILKGLTGVQSSSPEEIAAARQANLKGQNRAMIPELEEMGYSGENAQNYSYNWNGMNVNPETMREHYLQQALINEPSWGNPEGSGRLKSVVERLMQSRSLADLASQTSEFTEEGRRNYGQEGEFFKDDAGITPEQRELNQQFVDLIPTFQDYINTGGNQPGGFSYNPNADDTIIYSNFNTAVRNAVKNSTQQTAYTDPNTEDPSGFYPPTGDMPYDDFELITPEDLESQSYLPSSKLTGSGGNRPQLANLRGNETADTARLLAQSAAQLKLPPTVTKAAPTTKTSWSSGMKRGTGASGGGANRAAQGASALARLAKVLKGFK